MSRTTTKILRLASEPQQEVAKLTSEPGQVIAVRPVKWTDEQWDELVGRNREHYNVELIEEDWSYGE